MSINCKRGIKKEEHFAPLFYANKCMYDESLNYSETLISNILSQFFPVTKMLLVLGL